MGAGNRYTLSENRDVLAFQLDVSCDCWEENIYDCDCKECQLDYLKEIIFKLPLAKKYGMNDARDSFYYGEMFTITLENNYSGDAIVIGFELQNDFEQYGLQLHNCERTYMKVIKHINKYLPLFVGHGYTSSHYEINEIK